MDKKIKKIMKFCKRNYFIPLSFLIICFVGLVAVYKLVIKKPAYVYAEVKVGQGLWWASTQKPSLWFIDAMQKTKSESDYLGRETSKILSLKYYPWGGSSQYDVYLYMKLKVSKLGNSGKYSFNRSTIGVGAPVDFEFNKTQFSGTIIRLSENPIPDDAHVKKEIIITKKDAFPWEYDAIPVGDTYFNGIENTIEVISKDAIDTTRLAPDFYGNTNTELMFPTKYITVVLKVKGTVLNGQFIYGEETILIPGKETTLTTSRFVFNNYTVSEIK